MIHFIIIFSSWKTHIHGATWTVDQSFQCSDQPETFDQTRIHHKRSIPHACLGWSREKVCCGFFSTVFCSRFKRRKISSWFMLNLWKEFLYNLISFFLLNIKYPLSVSSTCEERVALMAFWSFARPWQKSVSWMILWWSNSWFTEPNVGKQRFSKARNRMDVTHDWNIHQGQWTMCREKDFDCQPKGEESIPIWNDLGPRIAAC